jgi:outer membrane receptor for ferrienterochelin and colicins
MNIYVSGQDTRRKHYTGIDGQDGYGTTVGNTFIGGIQADHLVKNFPGGANNLTIGTEYHYDDIFDEIPAYNYLIDQTARQVGMFAQSDWQITSWLNTLIGVRADKHNLVDKIIFNPRASLLVNAIQNTQIRASLSTGFRAPQAFDADMHIAFAGGGIAFINLAPDLMEETSKSVSLSATYDKATSDYIYGFTLEGFYTTLNDVFVLEEEDVDSVGNIILVKSNGSNSTVQGITIEVRGNYREKYQLETGITLQQSRFDDPVEWSADIPGTRDFLRSPGAYGYYTLSLTPTEKLNLSLSGVYTGPMKVPHFAGAPGVDEDILFTSLNFFETNFRISYILSIKDISQDLELFGGIQNIFNQFQDDFDIGKDRDSGYIYGPARPRTIFVGLKFGDILP